MRTRIPEREVLRRLLDSAKLTAADEAFVRQMHDDIVAGRTDGLGHPQRVRVEQLCRQCGVQLTQPAPRSETRRKKELENERLLAQFDALPRPKRPPGK
jgi:hypothetical protein